MGTLNHVVVMGYLGRDPEIRATPAGDTVATVNLATSESWKDKKSGQKVEQTEWHRIICWGPLADVVGQYLKKGSMALFIGKLQTRKWTDRKDNVERYTTEIRAFEVKLISSPDRDEPEERPAARPAQRTAQDYREATRGDPAPEREQHQARPRGHNFDDMPDDIPF